jgi:DNA modification methylase
MTIQRSRSPRRASAVGEKSWEARNRLNDLTAKQWIKFQKSWFIHNPPPRKREVLTHPAKFPETLVQEFIEFFTKSGQWVFDPLAGTGSTLIAALRAGRNSLGVELNPRYVVVARRLLEAERQQLSKKAVGMEARMIEGDALQILKGDALSDLPAIDYAITSPPYWDMLHARGAQTQKHRRADPDLDVFYSEDERDLGNVRDYDEFLDRLSDLFVELKPWLRTDAYLTIILKNVKKRGRLYPLAWDLASRLSATYTLKDERIWCQDNVRLAPYGLGSAWVSNTVHHYCLQFRKEDA